MFHYANLSDFEFELLCRDIMERKIGCPLHCFAPGRDGGVDITETKLSGKHMVQVKHYIDTALQLKERTPEGKTETAAALLCLLWEKADSTEYF